MLCIACCRISAQYYLGCGLKSSSRMTMLTTTKKGLFITYQLLLLKDWVMQWKMQSLKSLDIWVTHLVKSICYIICLKQPNGRHSYCSMEYFCLLNTLIIAMLQISICLVCYTHSLLSSRWLRLILIKYTSLPSPLYKALNTSTTVVTPKEFKSAPFRSTIPSTLPTTYKI